MAELRTLSSVFSCFQIRLLVKQYGWPCDEDQAGRHRRRVSWLVLERESDVLCVCGQTDLDYSGNIAFRKLLNMNKSIYESMSSSEDVRKLASSVAKLIEKNAVEDFLLANKKTMDTGEITIGEVVNLLYCDGKKSYIVAYTIGGNQMCIKPSSSEEYIKFSSKRAKENTIAAEARISEISGSESCSNVTNNELSSKR